ncbi:GNAT family protein [Neobacillus sp. PS3-34]|uniref:GNAT family N-acetyltransferase n=1 Tax=Neobacillus sp. PS3-34 TaxID=3070678 RepID=UPI0027E1283C|nr:GNAT family protein [Neobacillus sp. PS3-34]WML49938.1 GNAT family protein [Neobacillus sp. PS3-34]
MKFENFPMLETNRLILRKMNLDDASSVFQNLSNPLVTKDMGESPFTSIEQAENLITFMNNLYEENIAFRWGIIRKEDNVLIGTCGYNGWETMRGSRGEIAYDLGVDYWRQGYMVEAMHEMIDFGFNTMGLHRIEAFTNLDATPSMSILKKMGFNEDGVLRGYAFFNGEYWDQRCFSLLKNEWFTKKL